VGHVVCVVVHSGVGKLYRMTERSCADFRAAEDVVMLALGIFLDIPCSRFLRMFLVRGRGQPGQVGGCDIAKASSRCCYT